jgi:hypothetical protein
LLTYDPDCVLRWWLGDYAPQIAADDAERFPSLDTLLAWLCGGVVETVEVPSNCSDLFLAALSIPSQELVDPTAMHAMGRRQL